MINIENQEILNQIGGGKKLKNKARAKNLFAKGVCKNEQKDDTSKNKDIIKNQIGESKRNFDPKRSSINSIVTDTSINQSCPMEIDEFDVLDDCQSNDNHSKSTGKINVSVENSSVNSSIVKRRPKTCKY